MHNEFNAIVERDGDWFVAECPEMPEANGQVGRRMKRRAIWPPQFSWYSKITAKMD